ncbi:MAG: protoporphyrinogen oxidase [Legionella sp.]|jgi:HemY protein|nr:protoporphyrinogen oxidase [Legionella sp.]
MMRILLILLLLFASTWLGLHLHGDPGYVLLVFRHWTLETTVWVALAAMMLTFALLHLFFASYKKTVHLPASWHHWRLKRRAGRARNKTTQGLIEFSEGHWKLAKTHLVQALPDADTPLINYLVAARAAQALDDPKLRDDYLREAQQSMPDAKIAVELTQAQLQIAHQQWEQALATLRHLHDLSPRHPYVLKLLARLYEAIADWPQLIQILPDLTRHKALSEVEFNTLQHRAYLEGMRGYIQQSQWDVLHKLVDTLPKKLKYDPELIAMYSRALMQQNKDEEAETCLRRAFQKNYHDCLISAYSELKPAYAKLHALESLLKDHTRSPALHRCLGKFYIAQKLWGKARTHLDQSLALAEAPETYAVLGELLEALGDISGAFSAYQKGLNQALVIN